MLVFGVGVVAAAAVALTCVVAVAVVLDSIPSSRGTCSARTWNRKGGTT